MSSPENDDELGVAGGTSAASDYHVTRRLFMGRVFTLEEAQELMPRVKSITKPVFQLASSLAE